MRKFLSLLVTLTIWTSPDLNAQEDDCYRIDSVTYIAYYNGTDSLYNGNCEDFYKNGQLRCQGIFVNGIIVTEKTWNKKGNLMDSIIYTDGFHQSIKYIFNKDGTLWVYEEETLKKLSEIKDPVVLKYLQKKKIDGDTPIYMPDVTKIYEYYRDCKIKAEEYHKLGEVRYLRTEYYKNGNPKNSAYYIDKPTKLSSVYTVVKDSIYTEYDESGKKIIQLDYVEDKFRNPATKFNENGEGYKALLEIDESGNPKY